MSPTTVTTSTATVTTSTASRTSGATARTSGATARTNSTRDWTRRGDRAIPALETPRATEIDPRIMDHLRPLVILLVARPPIAAALLLVAAARGWYLALPVAIWFLYGSSLAAVHQLLHGGLGMTARWRHRWLTALALLVGESGHALLATHTHHHRDGSDRPDPEGWIEYLSWRQLPLGAVRYRYRLMAWGFRHGTRRRRISAELVGVAALHLVALALTPWTPIGVVYVGAIDLAAIGFAVLQSKGPQANWGRDMSSPLLLVRTRLLAILFFHHHQHLEHHAFPKVPVTRLHRLRPALEDALADAEVIDLRLPV